MAAVVERVLPADAPAAAVAADSTPQSEPEPSPEPEPVDTTYRTPEVAFPTTIPGCDVVEPPSVESATLSASFTSEDVYDNPQYPWYSGPRSVMMTRAVADALPDGVDVLFGSHRESLTFQPIPMASTEPGEPLPQGFASASGEVGRGDSRGQLAVSVSQGDGVVPPCVAGSVTERSRAADGTVMDANESWYEYGSDRTTFRSVVAYAPDGSQISATSSDAAGFQSTNTGERDTVLTVDELKALAALPELRVTAAVPADTPEPVGGCDNSFGYFSGDQTIDAASAAALNSALDGVDVGQRFEPKLGTLMLADFETGVVCTRADVLGTGADVSISIRGGQALPTVPSVYDPAYPGRPLETEMLDGGAVMQVEESKYSYSPAAEGGPTGGMRRSVTVTYPSGTQVEVRSHAEDPDEPLGVDTLRTIATTDGLDIL